MTHSAYGPQTRHGCIIMASGTSTRFGANKLIAEIGGVPLIQHVLRATDGLYARRVVVTRHPDIARLCDMRGVEAVLHNEPLRNDTVRLGMEKMADCDTVTFVQGDQPLVSANSLAACAALIPRPGHYYSLLNITYENKKVISLCSYCHAAALCSFMRQ